MSVSPLLLLPLPFSAQTARMLCSARQACTVLAVCRLGSTRDMKQMCASSTRHSCACAVRLCSSPVQRPTQHPLVCAPPPLRAAQAAVKAITWSPHQHGLLASGGGTADRCIRFWNTASGLPINSIDTGSQVRRRGRGQKHTGSGLAEHGPEHRRRRCQACAGEAGPAHAGVAPTCSRGRARVFGLGLLVCKRLRAWLPLQARAWAPNGTPFTSLLFGMRGQHRHVHTHMHTCMYACMLACLRTFTRGHAHA